MPSACGGCRAKPRAAVMLGCRKRRRPRRGRRAAPRLLGQAHAAARQRGSVEQHAVDRCIGKQREIAPPARGGQVGQRGTLAHAVDDVARHHARADGARRVVVGHGREVRRGASLQEGTMLGQQRLRRIATDRQRPGTAVPSVVALGVTLDPAEEGQHIGEGPTRISGRHPLVVFSGATAHGHRPVRGRTAADQLGA
ncbi:MAG: hypothetical protein U1F67_08615 [Rubrivivax sp.]